MKSGRQSALGFRIGPAESSLECYELQQKIKEGREKEKREREGEISPIRIFAS